MLNTLTNAVKAVVNCEIISPDGKSVARFKGTQKVGGELQATLKLQSKVSSPVLWSPESPKLYKLVTTVSVDGKTVDQKETIFGIRTAVFDPDKGFVLNGKHYEIYGVCNHQDHAGVGVALPDRCRITALTAQGNGLQRLSHLAQSAHAGAARRLRPTRHAHDG